MSLHVTQCFYFVSFLGQYYHVKQNVSFDILYCEGRLTFMKVQCCENWK